MLYISETYCPGIVHSTYLFFLIKFLPRVKALPCHFESCQCFCHVVGFNVHKDQATLHTVPSRLAHPLLSGNCLPASQPFLSLVPFLSLAFEQGMLPPLGVVPLTQLLPVLVGQQVPRRLTAFSEHPYGYSKAPRNMVQIAQHVMS